MMLPHPFLEFIMAVRTAPVSFIDTVVFHSDDSFCPCCDKAFKEGEKILTTIYHDYDGSETDGYSIHLSCARPDQVECVEDKEAVLQRAQERYQARLAFAIACEKQIADSHKAEQKARLAARKKAETAYIQARRLPWINAVKAAFKAKAS